MKEGNVLGDFFEVFLQLFLEVVLLAGWDTIQSGSPWSLPIIAILGLGAIVLFLKAIMPDLLPRVIDLPVDSLLQSTVSTEQVYRVEGSEMVDLGHHKMMLTNSNKGAYVGLLTVGDHQLVVSSPRPIDENRLTYKGRLTSSVDPEIKRQISADAPKPTGLLSVTLNVYQRRFTVDLAVWILIEIAMISVIMHAIGRFVSVNLR